MKDSEIDYSDIPDLSKQFARHLKSLQKERKKMVSLRLDLDVLDWLRSRGKGYQTEVNAVLRAWMMASKDKA